MSFTDLTGMLAIRTVDPPLPLFCILLWCRTLVSELRVLAL